MDQPFIIIAAAFVALTVSLAGGRLGMASAFLPDQPNHRSSHTHTTSRAGGLSIFAAWLSGMFVIGAFSGDADLAIEAVKLSGLAALAFLVGLADDRWALRPAFKFAGQFVVAGLFMWICGPLEMAPLPFFGETTLGLAGYGLTAFWIIGFMNAFNFMDGVNGIAAGCTAIGLGAYAVIASFSGAPMTAAAALLLAVACFGFLPANLGRGRLFMGDSGSQAASFLIAALAVYGANASGGRASALVLPVIFLPFIFDVTWTLARRLFRGQNILKAHREHLYQLRNRLGASHARVAIIYMTLTAFSAAAAILMLTLAPAVQVLAPAILCAVFAVLAAMTQAEAAKAGLLAILAPDVPEVDERLQTARDTDVATRSASAAE